MLTQDFKNKFQRRTDLTVESRLRIGSIAALFAKHGTITRLADKNNISRQFVYDLRNKFLLIGEETFGISPSKESNHQEDCLRAALFLRLEGKCSIGSISKILERFNLPYSSVGFISEHLKSVGEKIGEFSNVSNTDNVVSIVFCSDEVFANDEPILITAEPLSLTILGIKLGKNRKSETWQTHWKSLAEQGYYPIQITSDEGTGLVSAMSELFPTINHQSERNAARTFHAVAHRLGLWCSRLEKVAFKTIELEYDAERLFYNSKSEEVCQKRWFKYEQFCENCKTAIDTYETFQYLYHCLLSCFQVFNEVGELKEKSKVMADFDTALDYIKTLGISAINDEIKSIELCKNNLFYFFDVTKNIVNELAKSTDKVLLEKICVAWQTHKNSIKAKQTTRKNTLIRKEKYLLAEINAMIGGKNEVLKNKIYASLNHIIQSSAAVECINRIGGPIYLKTLLKCL